MCGIAGILGENELVDAGKLNVLKDSLAHRGPDAQSIYVSKDKRLGLVHTRLSIQDLTDRASQPMVTRDGRYAIVFNGEIYNFKVLRKQLATQGEKFLSDSDTEVILKLYLQRKEKCLNDLEGMFAFSIWDDLKKELFLARDAFGIKPLYCANEGGSFLFASEHQALQKALSSKPRFDSHAIKSFLRKGSIPEPLSVDVRIRMIPAGHFAYWRNGAFDKLAAFAPILISESRVVMNLKDAASIARRALLESVENHFVSDVEVGIFLSGGLDSTALLALSRESGHTKLSTYTVGFKNLPDEAALARKTAKHFETNHHEVMVDAQSADSMLDGYLAATDQPTIDGFNVYVISKFAHENGAKVVLSGLGSDELFGGYKTLRAVPQLYQIASNPAGKAALSLFSFLMKNIQANSKWKRLRETLNKKIAIESIYAAYRGIFTSSEASEILKALGIQNHLETGRNDFIEKPDSKLSLADQVDWLEWTVYLRDQLLRDADIFSMHFGLELRVPFVDFKLFNTLAQIPSEIRLNQKQLLKAAVPEIPEWIRSQPKRGFLFPFSSWNLLDRHFKSETIKRLAGHYSDWYQKWALLQLDCLISKIK